MLASVSCTLITAVIALFCTCRMVALWRCGMEYGKGISRSNKCVSIDWLEVYCNELEPAIHDDLTKDFSMAVPKPPDFFRERGYEVKVREYGTPQYRSMFCVLDPTGEEWLEIRRDPYSLRRDGGIFNVGDCHIRLSNRTCYAADPIDELRLFMRLYGYRYISITRIDIALDFVFFDDGSLPEDFAKAYIQDEFYKVNLSKVHAYGKDITGAEVAIHGRDSFVKGKIWNSLKWGAPTSAISVKLYNKSLELREKKVKWYIVDRWEAYLLPMSEHDVWRIEFSLRSQVKDFVRVDDGTLIHSSLSAYDTPLKLMHMWMILAKKYFLFKKKVYTRNGSLQRKDRCPDYYPIRISAIAIPYHRIDLTTDHDTTRTDKIMLNKLDAIINNPHCTDRRLIEAANELTRFFVYTKRAHKFEANVKEFIERWDNESCFTKEQVEKVFEWAETQAQKVLGVLLETGDVSYVDDKLQKRIIESQRRP